MKKILSATLIAGLFSGAAFAQTTVSSANVVGYVQVELAPGISVLHVPFVNGLEAIDIQNIMSTTNLTRGTGVANADNILFWDNIGLKYDRYFVHNGVGPGNAAKTGKWVADSNQTIAVRAVSPSQGFFFTKAGATAVTNFISGDVVIAATGTNSLVLVEGFNLVANPFSSDWRLNDTNFNWIAKGAIANTGVGNSDSIHIWNRGSLQYTRYFLHNGIGPGNVAKTGKWVEDITGLIATNLTIGINQGFFYSRKIGAGTVTIQIPQPYTLN